ncbi:MAG TPA: Flp family type IVb pilin [Vicinamibacterales bacterium]|jgi:pilus assembly protein Flp/PilA|nr:Flp family type IVb pilin [Vicinamibacterales bacterium]
MASLLSKFRSDESGQDLIEYGLLVGVITVAAIAAIGLISTKVSGYFTNLNTGLP